MVASFPKSYQLCLEASMDFSEVLVFIWMVQLNGRRVTGLKASLFMPLSCFVLHATWSPELKSFSQGL